MKNILYQESIVEIKHLFHIMKITALALFIFAGTAFATESYSQVMKVTIMADNISAGKVINEIEKQTDYLFVYNVNEVNLKRTVKVNAKKKPVAEVLNKIFAGTDIYYAMEGKNIMLMSKGEKEEITQQENKITGIVKDANGEPIIGANVTVKGQSIGTITDIDGRFVLNAPVNAVLQITYIGYIPQETNVGNKKELYITLKEDSQLLDEVVVVGYGSMKKSDLTGAVVSANLKDFEKSPNTNVVQSLQGTVPGLNVGQVTSAGATPSISIRGTNTLSGNKDVLIILDGIIYTSSLSSINPNDIASIDVLKDASATAVYGAQAANGVLLITTKKGKVGQTRINFSTAYTTSNPTKNLRPMNREEFIEFTKDYWYDKAYTGPDYTTPNPDFRVADYMVDAPMLDNTQPDGLSVYDWDWWDEGTQTASIFENKLSITGGTEAISYLISYANTNQKGFMVNDDFKRNSVRINLDTKPYKWLNLGMQTFASFVNQDGAQPGVWDIITSNPLTPAFDKEGELIPYPFQGIGLTPLATLFTDDKERHNYFFANFYAEIKLPVKGLTYRLNYGNNYRTDEHFQANPYGASLTGEAYKQHTSYYDYTVDNIVNYAGTFGKHDIAATFLYGASERKQNYTEAKAQNFSRMTLGYNNLQLGKEQFTKSEAWDEALLYQMLRVNYKYLDRYLLTATARRDGFSGFAENNKFAIFPSVAVGWIISEEKFFKLPWVDQLKLRAGWGISGNQTSRYKSLARMESNSGYVFGDGGTTEILQKVNSMGNPDLKWEKTEGFNFGLDFNLLNNRLTGSLEAYRTITRDLLYDMTIPSMTGFSSISTNIGKIRNRGVELTLTSRNFVQKDFEWSTTFNISSNSNKILSLLGRDQDGDGREDDLTASNLFIGESTSAIYGYIIDGIYQLHDDIPAGYNPGNYKIRDVTGEGKITVDDRVILGKEDPAYRFSLLNAFRWKDFTFSFFINSVQGGKHGYLGKNTETLVRGDANSRRWNRISELAKDYWSPNNPDGTYSRSINAGAISPTAYQDRSFIRLQDITLGYNLPQKWVRTIGLQNLNLYVNGKNLLTFTNWKGWDPETSGGYFSTPVMRSFTFGLNITL